MFEQLKMPSPDFNLEVKGGLIGDQTGRIMTAFEKLLPTISPDLVLVVGDVNSTIASAFVAKQHKITVCHVEAGLRSNDLTMPEEVNRILTDSISDLLFVSEPSGVKNLESEGISEQLIHYVGNVMIDTLMKFRPLSEISTILKDLNLNNKDYGVVTLHRPATVDDPEVFEKVIDALSNISDKIPLVWPVHPRTYSTVQKFSPNAAQLITIKPQGYLDFLCLISRAKLIFTDSGGIQEEAAVLKVPCLTLRENTERPCTIDSGWNQLVGTDPMRIQSGFDSLNSAPNIKDLPKLWDGKASQRIAKILSNL